MKKYIITEEQVNKLHQVLFAYDIGAKTIQIVLKDITSQPVPEENNVADDKKVDSTI